MSRLGTNIRLALTADATRIARDVFAGALGAKVIEPRPNLVVFRFEGGAQVGTYVVPDDQALTPEQQSRGAWLEFVVADRAAAAKACVEAGCALMDYGQGEGVYLSGPGGLVFRLVTAP